MRIKNNIYFVVALVFTNIYNIIRLYSEKESTNEEK